MTRTRPLAWLIGPLLTGLLALASLVSGCASAPDPSSPDTASSPTHSSDPGPRWGHALQWDPIRKELLLFGGSRERGVYLADTWTFDGTWRRREGPGPAARGFAGLAFHPGRGTLVLHGGRADGRKPHDDTWEWDGSGWTRIEDAGSYAADHHALVFVPESQELVAFGGWTGTSVSAETWSFDGSWRLLDCEGPPARSAFGMAYDAARQSIVLYGGLWLNGQYADVWTFKDERWRPLGGPYERSSLDHHALTYDPLKRRVVGFGGKDYRYQARGETFALLRDQPVVLTSEGPSPRHSSPLAWDAERECVVLYGGKSYAEEAYVPLEGLWGFDGERWERLDG